MRRLLSVLLYIVAGLFLMGWCVMAFVRLDPGESKAEMFAVMAAFALVPLALGAWASPGARLREVGIVLLAASAWGGFSVGTILYTLLMPDTRKSLPPETLDSLAMFSDHVTGAAFLALSLAGSMALIRYGGRKGGARSRTD